MCTFRSRDRLSIWDTLQVMRFIKIKALITVNVWILGDVLLPHLELRNIFCVSLWWLCRNVQKIQLSLKFCYSLLGLEVDNTHWCYPLGVYQSPSGMTRFKKGASTMAATCWNSSESCCLWAASPCSFSVVWLNSFWNWTKTNNKYHSHRQMAYTSLSVGSFLWQSSSTTHPHAQKLLDLCAKLVASQVKVKHKLSVDVKNRTNKYLKTKGGVSMLKKVREAEVRVREVRLELFPLSQCKQWLEVCQRNTGQTGNTAFCQCHASLSICVLWPHPRFRTRVWWRVEPDHKEE